MFNTFYGNGVMVWPCNDYKQIDDVNTVIDPDNNKMSVSVSAAIPVEFQFLDIHIPFVSVPHNHFKRKLFKKYRKYYVSIDLKAK